MAISVEDGTGVATAESYVSVAELKAYAAGFGSLYADVATKTDAELEAALRIGTIFIDGRGRDKRNDLARWWPGTRVTGAQALVWPRTAATFTDGTSIANDSVPVQIKRATMESASYEAINPGSLHDLIISSQSIKKEKVGDLEIEYTGKIDDFEKLRPLLSRSEDYIAQIIRLPEVSDASGTTATTSASFNFLSVGS